jgi:hypothetical protein
MKQNISSNLIRFKTNLEPISENLLKHATTLVLGKEKNAKFETIVIEKLLPYEKRFVPIESYDRMSMSDNKSFNKIVSYLKKNTYFLIIDILPFHEIYCLCRDFDENCYFLIDPYTKRIYSDLTDNFFNEFLCHFKKHFETVDKSIDVTTIPLSDFPVQPSFVSTLFKFNFFFRENTKEIFKNINECLSYEKNNARETKEIKIEKDDSKIELLKDSELLNLIPVSIPVPVPVSIPVPISNPIQIENTPIENITKQTRIQTQNTTQIQTQNPTQIQTQNPTQTQIQNTKSTTNINHTMMIGINDVKEEEENKKRKKTNIKMTKKKKQKV